MLRTLVGSEMSIRYRFHHIAEDRNRRRLEAGRSDLLRDIGKRAAQRLLPPGCTPTDQSHGRLASRAMFEQLASDGADPLDTHEHDLRAGRCGELREVERAFRFRRIFVSGENGELRVVLAMRDGNARVGWRR